MKQHPQAKVVKLVPKGTLLGWIARNNLTLWFLAVALCWLLLANKWCNGEKQGFQYNTTKTN